MQSPLISIVIPTTDRPAFLPRAVDSALAGMATGNVEVIVVPNGPDDSWRKSLSQYHDNPDVRVLPIATRHACVARNHGLHNARGKYIRFLDDDDYLYPEGACRQYQEIEKHGADVCSGDFDVVDHHQQRLSTMRQSNTDDLVVGFVSNLGMWQPTSHVFRREVVNDVPWDEELSFCQDFDWMSRLCARKTMKWIRCNWTVGAWSRHVETRISLDASLDAKKQVVAERIFALADNLEEQGLLTEGRRDAAAVGLWDCVHAALCFNPLYWTLIALRARALSPNSRPSIPFYNDTFFRHWLPNPLLWEWLMLPKRLFWYWGHRALVFLGLARYG